MSKTLDRRVTEWGLWFHKNKDRIPAENVRRRLDFLEKAIDGCVECLAIATKDIQELEGSKPGASLWLPKGIKVNGDVRELD